jgi:hypothetical protein
LLAALDAEEAGDPAGTRYVAAALKRIVMATSPDGRLIAWRPAAPAPAAPTAPAWSQARPEPVEPRSPTQRSSSPTAPEIGLATIRASVADPGQPDPLAAVPRSAARPDRPLDSPPVGAMRIKRLKYKSISGWLDGQRRSQAEADSYLGREILPYLHPGDAEVVDALVEALVAELGADDSMVVRCVGWAPPRCLRGRTTHGLYELTWLAGYQLAARGLSLISSFTRWTYSLRRLGSGGERGESA